MGGQDSFSNYCTFLANRACNRKLGIFLYIGVIYVNINLIYSIVFFRGCNVLLFWFLVLHITDFLPFYQTERYQYFVDHGLDS